MERQSPKNVRQIGNVSDSPKIYVEDYVDTFFLQLCDKAKDGPIGAFLVGDMQKSEDEEYVYIYGARAQKIDGNAVWPYTRAPARGGSRPTKACPKKKQTRNKLPRTLHRLGLAWP